MGHAARQAVPAATAEDGDDSRRAWLDAGQDLLRRGGFQSVKLAPLCELTGRTTGSFYHHFGGMADYLDELAAYFGGEQPRSVLEQMADLPPQQRLRRLQELGMQLHMGSLHLAMRDWATASGPAAVAVREADRVLLEFIRDCLTDAGVDVADAEQRAEVLYALGVARFDTPWRRRTTSVDRLLVEWAGPAPHASRAGTGS